MPKNLRFDARRGTSVPYDSPTPGLTRQLQRLVTEERPALASGAGLSTTAVSEAAPCCARSAGLWR